MKVNFTIFVQAINFFVAWFILNRLLFKPAIKFLKGEELKEKSLSDNIHTKQTELDSKREEKQKTWEKYQAYFSKNCPVVEPQGLYKIEDLQKEPEIIDLSKQEIDNLKQHMERTLVERLEYVRK